MGEVLNVQAVRVRLEGILEALGVTWDEIDSGLQTHAERALQNSIPKGGCPTPCNCPACHEIVGSLR
jgi:hypothetical protein